MVRLSALDEKGGIVQYGKTPGPRGPSGPQGATGPAGNGAVFQSVDALSGTPRSVTDWGALINTALTAGTRHFVFGPYDYPFTTMINAAQLQGVVFEGSAGLSWYDPGSGQGFTRLVWGGTGSGFAIDFHSASTGVNGNVGPVLKDLMLLYSSSSYTGKLINYINSTMPCIERCFIGPTAASGATSADHALELDAVNTFHAINTTFSMKAAHGRSSSNNYSNIAQFTNCTFDDRAATNPGKQWLFDHCDFEFPSLAGGTGMITTDGFLYTTGDAQADVTLRDCQVWDASAGTQYLVSIPASVPIDVLIEHLEDNSSKLAALVSHLGTGDLTVVNSNTANIIDCGDATSTTHKKQRVKIVNNKFFSTTVSAMLVHTVGHFQTEVHSNSLPNGNNIAAPDSFQTIGHRRADWITTPSIAAHTGISNLIATIIGNDSMGLIILQNTSGSASATGLLADITLANPPTSARTSNGGFQFPHILLTPASVSANAFASGTGAAAAACQPYAFTKALDNGGSQGAWSIGVGVAIPGSTYVAFFYEVKHL